MKFRLARAVGATTRQFPHDPPETCFNRHSRDQQHTIPKIPTMDGSIRLLSPSPQGPEVPLKRRLQLRQQLSPVFIQAG